MTDLLIHRGIVNKNYKENLIKSFKQSFKKGYGIETDIHATKDDKFICFHDFTLNRIFRKNVSVKNLNYSKIKEISSKNKRTIPLLKDLLKTSKNKYPLFIELKPSFSKKLLKKLLKETSKYPKCVFISFYLFFFTLYLLLVRLIYQILEHLCLQLTMKKTLLM